MVSESHELTPEERRELANGPIPYMVASALTLRSVVQGFPRRSSSILPGFFLPQLLILRVQSHRIQRINADFIHINI